MPQIHEDSPEEVEVGTKTILVVEDDDAIIELITLVLSQETPYSPLVVADASEALRLATHLKVDLFLIDYQLAGMNGLQLYDTLHSMEGLQTVPALLLSASVEKHEQELRERNLLGLNKPFELDELLQTIEKMLAPPSKR
jgi:CheY-like chemotaxis protein